MSVVPIDGIVTSIARNANYIYYVDQARNWILRQAQMTSDLPELVLQVPEEYCVLDIDVSGLDIVYAAVHGPSDRHEIWRIDADSGDIQPIFQGPPISNLGLNTNADTIYWVSAHAEIFARNADGSGNVRRVLAPIAGFAVCGVAGDVDRPFFTLNEGVVYVEDPCTLIGPGPGDAHTPTPPPVIPGSPGYVLRRIITVGAQRNELIFRGLTPGQIAFDAANGYVFWIDLQTNRVLSRRSNGTGPTEVVFTFPAGAILDVDVWGEPGLSQVVMSAYVFGIPSAPGSGIVVQEIPHGGG